MGILGRVLVKGGFQLWKMVFDMHIRMFASPCINNLYSVDHISSGRHLNTLFMCGDICYTNVSMQDSRGSWYLPCLS